MVWEKGKGHQPWFSAQAHARICIIAADSDNGISCVHSVMAQLSSGAHKI